MKRLDQSSLQPLVKHPENKHVVPRRDQTPAPNVIALGSEYSTKELAGQILSWLFGRSTVHENKYVFPGCDQTRAPSDYSVGKRIFYQRARNPDIILILKLYLTSPVYLNTCVSIKWLWYHCGTQRPHQEHSKPKCSFRSFYSNRITWKCNHSGVPTINRIDQSSFSPLVKLPENKHVLLLAVIKPGLGLPTMTALGSEYTTKSYS